VTPIFAYGTLRDPETFRLVAGTSAPLAAAVPATLPGYRRVTLCGTPYPTLLRDPGTETDGLLLHVPPKILRRLHIYEGPAYRFVPVMLRVGSTRVRAHAWIAANADPATPWP
jgi:gamma-glutamylcyclotransferase (GGCT)/AIG2-like uncharacterized protein YtfP